MAAPFKDQALSSATTRAIESAHRRGASIRALAQSTGWSRSRVRQAVLASGQSVRDAQPARPSRSWWEARLGEGCSATELATELDVSTMTVYRSLRRLGLSFPRPDFEGWLRGHTVRSGNCLIWTGTHSSRGYPIGSWNATTTLAARIIWRHEHGPIAVGHEIVHTPDCANRSCVAPAHLECLSSRERAARSARAGRIPHGERHWNSRLTEAQAEAILSSALAAPVLARRYHVSVATINAIRSGHRWRYLRESRGPASRAGRTT